MNIFPSELDFRTFFQISAEDKIDKVAKVPFYYNRTTFHFSNKEQRFEVAVAPSKNYMGVTVFERKTSSLIKKMTLKNITHFEFIQLDDERASIYLKQNLETVYQFSEITFKPFFQHKEKQYLNRI